MKTLTVLKSICLANIQAHKQIISHTHTLSSQITLTVHTRTDFQILTLSHKLFFTHILLSLDASLILSKLSHDPRHFHIDIGVTAGLLVGGMIVW